LIRLNFKNNFVLFVAISFLIFPVPARALLQVNQVILISDFDKETSLGSVVKREEAYGKTGASLVLNFEVRQSGSFVFFNIPLTVPLTDMSYFSFWLKAGEKTKESAKFYVEFWEDTNGDSKFNAGTDANNRVPAAGFLGKPDPEGWQKVTIPLSSFSKIHHWGRASQVAIFFESDQPLTERLLIDNLLFGSNYPEEFHGKEISMQNRLSSFKIDHELASPEMKLEIKLKQKSIPLACTLTFIDPYLEEIRFEESRDGGQTWSRIQSFYDHSLGGVYASEVRWTNHHDAPSKEGFLVRAVGLNLLGGETNLAGPYHVHVG